MTQEMMQRSKLGVLPTWGDGLGGVRTVLSRGAPLPHPFPVWKENPMLHRSLLFVINAPHAVPRRDQLLLTGGVAAPGVGAWRLSNCVLY